MANDDQAWLDELGKKTGVTIGETDLANLQGKNAEDREGFKAALEKQYGERASNVPNYGAGDEKGSVTSAWGGNGGGQSSAPAAPSWQDTYFKNFADRQDAAAAEAKGRADALYGTLTTRANQSLAVDRNDPMVRQQADAYSANAERQSRGYLADLAERAGPTANLLGEQRLAHERVGQATGTFEAGLIGKELQARRDEIAQALAQMGNALSADQARGLQQQLATIDGVMKQKGFDIQSQLGNRGLDVQSQLGNRGLDIDWQKALMSNDQFTAQLGLNAADRASYWDYANKYGL